MSLGEAISFVFSRSCRKAGSLEAVRSWQIVCYVLSLWARAGWV